MASKRNSGIFEVESDEDSIKTDTTAESEYDDAREFAVESILAEEMKGGPDGEMHYLLKWEGYPLYQCTWEKKSNITSKLLLKDWQKEKLAIRRGEKTPFDINEFNLAVERWLEGKEEKKERRAAKRRRRAALAYSPEAGEASYSDDEHSKAHPTKAVRTKSQPVKRKGMAQPIKKARKRGSLERDENGESPSDSDDFQSTLASKQVKKPTSTSPPSKKTKPVPISVSGKLVTGPAQTAATTAATTAPAPAIAAVATTTAAAVTKPNNPPETERIEPANGTASKEVEARRASDSQAVPIAPWAARKSVQAPAPKAVPLRRLSTSNVFAGDWAEPKKGRQRPRVNGETRKESTDPKFTKLSIQNRYQKCGQNEPPPDPNALSMIDPRTGVVEPPKTVPPKLGPAEIHSAYGRRTPPPASKERSASPESGAREQAPAPASRLTVQPTVDTGVASSGASIEGPKTASGIPFKRITCKYWQAGNCHLTDEKCPWAHYHTGLYALDSESRSDSRSDYRPDYPPKKMVTCYYWWKQGYCSKREEDCEFAHFGTGHYAGAPGTFKRGSGVSNMSVIKTTDSARAVSSLSPPPISSEAPHSVPPPPAAEAVAARSDQRSFAESQVNDKVNATPAKVDEQPEPLNTRHSPETSNTSTRDPRLAGRSLSLDAATKSPPKDPRLRPTATDKSDSIAGAAEMPTSERFTHGSIEEDLRMAQRGIRKLDASKMLKSTNGAKSPIEHVYIHMRPERAGEVSLLKDYLTKELNCKVYVTKPEFDNWKYFRSMFKKHPSLLIVHPSENFIRGLPDFHNFLIENGATFRVFSIGVQHQRCILEQREPAYEAQRLFPHGGVTFISDDVFVYYPEKATDIIQEFLKDTRAKPPGAELSKIGARPGIKDWVARLATKKFEEQGGEGEATDLRWVKCYEALCQLCPLEDEDPDFPNHSVPLEISNLLSVWEDALPSFKGRWESGDEEGATEYMVNHFAGEACSKVSKYRKFLFVYQRPGTVDSHGEQVVKHESDPKGWMKKYNHIGVVTPDQVLKLMKGKR